MQKINGTTILTGTFMAISSAHWRRFVLISLDWTRNTWPTGIPNASACTMAETNERRSGIELRSPRARSASERPTPSCISRRHRLNSPASAPVVFCATCIRAASKPRPDSTEIVSRSMASGSSRCIFSVRSLAVECRYMFGPKNPATVPPATTTSMTAGPKPRTRQKRDDIPRPATAPTILPAETLSTVQPGGFPARSSLCRIRSVASAPVSRRPSFTNRAYSGSITRSPNERSSSLVISVGAAVIASRTARERLIPWLSGAMPPTAAKTTNRARNTMATPANRIIVVICSHVDFHYFAHPEAPDAEQYDRGSRAWPARSAW